MRISSAVHGVADPLLVGATNPAINEISAAIVSDHPLLRRSLAARVSARAPELSVVATVSSWLELLAHPRGRFDVVVLDIDTDDGIPLRAKVAALETCAAAIVPVSNDPGGPSAQAALAAGTRPVVAKVGDAGLGAWLSTAWHHDAYLPTSVSADPPADRVSADVRPNLSEQERRVLVLYVSGHKMAAVARRLNLKYDTAKSYLDRVRDKYERVGRAARTKLDLYHRAIQDGWLEECPEVLSRTPVAESGPESGPESRPESGPASEPDTVTLVKVQS